MPVRGRDQTVKSLGDKQVSSKTAQEAGKGFEQEFQSAMNGAQGKNPLALVRLYDTRSAGSFLPEQPGDFIVTYAGKNFLIECKTSAKYATMSKGRSVLTSNISSGQVAAMRVWRRAGAYPLVLFRHAGCAIEIWRGEDVATAYLTTKATLEGVAFYSAKNFQEVITFLANYQGEIQ